MNYFIALICFIVSVLQWFEKGIPLNNAYLWNVDRRSDGDWSKAYRQSANVFFMLALANLTYGLSRSLQVNALKVVGIGLMVLIIIYAFASHGKLSR